MKVSRKEINAGKLSPRTLQNAVREFLDAGFVVLEQVVSRSQIESVRVAFETHFEKHIQKPEVRARIDAGSPYVGMHVPFTPPFTDPLICANPLAVQVMKAIMEDDILCSFYHSNTTLPGSHDFQAVHIDMPGLLFPGFPVALPPWLIVINFPLINFTLENGATEIWPGTHLNTEETHLAERIPVMPSVRATAYAGDLVIRDLRVWHRGAPNHLDRIRTMLAIVYNRSWFKIPPPLITMTRPAWEELPEYAQSIFRDNHIIGDDSA